MLKRLLRVSEETLKSLRYFRAVNVDPSEARYLFQLIDLNDSGSIALDESPS